MSSNLGRRLLELTRRGACLGLALAMAVPTLALADDHRGPGHGGGNQGYTRHMPADRRVVNHGGQRYYYHGGHYYRPYHGGGYVYARPPRGMRLGWLPLGVAAVVLAGATYYTLNGVYYSPVPGGYVVVDPPPGVVVADPGPPVVVDEGPAPSSPASGMVSVVSPTLNVRSGPGFGYPVLAVVNRGTALVVKSVAAGWFYVEVPGGQRGWVAQQYTTPLAPSGPNG